MKPPPLLAEVEPELPKQTAAEEEDRCNGMMAKHSGPVVTVGDTLHRIRIAVQNRWRKRLVARSAATEKEKSPIQKLPFADEAWQWAALFIAQCGVGLGSGPEHLCLGPKSCCLATIVCTCRDLFLWFYFEVPKADACKMPDTFNINPFSDMPVLVDSAESSDEGPRNISVTSSDEEEDFADVLTGLFLDYVTRRHPTHDTSTYRAGLYKFREANRIPMHAEASVFCKPMQKQVCFANQCRNMTPMHDVAMKAEPMQKQVCSANPWKVRGKRMKRRVRRILRHSHCRMDAGASGDDSWLRVPAET